MTSLIVTFVQIVMSVQIYLSYLGFHQKLKSQYSQKITYKNLPVDFCLLLQVYLYQALFSPCKTNCSYFILSSLVAVLSIEVKLLDFAFNSIFGTFQEYLCLAFLFLIFFSFVINLLAFHFAAYSSS